MNRFLMFSTTTGGYYYEDSTPYGFVTDPPQREGDLAEIFLYTELRVVLVMWARMGMSKNPSHLVEVSC